MNFFTEIMWLDSSHFQSLRSVIARVVEYHLIVTMILMCCDCARCSLRKYLL